MYTLITTLLTMYGIARPVLGALDPTSMQQRLSAGAPILGTYKDDSGVLASWMTSLSDNTTLVSLNIPGTHDTCAWNYTGLLPEVYNTQSSPIFDQLNGGIRFLDLRIGANDGKVMLYHADALLSDTAQIVDVLYGLYYFLDAHPSETIIASIKVDHGVESDPTLQQLLYDQFTTSPTNDYWVQGEDLVTLGAARHKIVLFRRYNLIPSLSPIGIPVAQGWTDNAADFVIRDNADLSVFVEDLYEIDNSTQPMSTIIKTKFDAFTTHLDDANLSANKTQLFVSFASGSGMGGGTEVFPKGLAVGNSTANVTGVNGLARPWLVQHKGNRFGVVLFDFFDSEPGLVEAVLGIPPVTSANSTASTATSSGNATGTATGISGSQSAKYSSSSISTLSRLPWLQLLPPVAIPFMF
ncbi:hypothetical protein FRB94_007735 [Tulasnella sp. JGI-2019a]|nr:hypothetical protein FRB94_007735 [Tulasnella sp. JGI-2019a]